MSELINLDRDQLSDGDILSIEVSMHGDRENSVWLGLSHRCANGQIGLTVSELQWLLDNAIETQQHDR